MLSVETTVEAQDGRFSLTDSLTDMGEKRDQDSDLGPCMDYNLISRVYLADVFQDNAGKTTLLYRLKVLCFPLWSSEGGLS